jgi:hypothetical protein
LKRPTQRAANGDKRLFFKEEEEEEEVMYFQI